MEYEYLQGEDFPQIFTDTIREAKRELKLNEGLPKASQEVKDRMVVAVAEGIVETSGIVGVKNPR